MVAAHTAGLPYPPLGTGLTGLDLQRGESVTAALAGATPLWEPGTAMAYHPVTYGTLLDEIARRATGTPIAQHVRSWVGRAAGGRHVDGPAGRAHPAGPAGAVGGEQSDGAGPGAPPRTGVVCRAAAGGPRGEPRRWTRSSPTPTRSARHVKTLIESGTAGPDIRFALGCQLASPNRPGFGPTTFGHTGHTGAGGRLGIADPEHQIGYVCSLMRNIGPDGDPRWKALIEAIGMCL